MHKYIIVFIRNPRHQICLHYKSTTIPLSTTTTPWSLANKVSNIRTLGVDHFLLGLSLMDGLLPILSFRPPPFHSDFPKIGIYKSQLPFFHTHTFSYLYFPQICFEGLPPVKKALIVTFLQTQRTFKSLGSG